MKQHSEFSEDISSDDVNKKSIDFGSIQLSIVSNPLNNSIIINPSNIWDIIPIFECSRSEI
jgi:hypothetical protein